MKKFNLIVGIVLIFSFSVYSQSQRLVLFEEFTSASCSWCAYYNPGFNTLLNNNADKCTSIKYQSNFGYDPMYNHNPNESSARASYYSVPGYPDVVMDGNAFHGSPGSVNQSMINTQSAIPSPFEITVNQQFSPGNDSIYVTMLGKATAAVSGLLVAQCVIIEKHIHFNSPPGSNGEKDFYNVMKKMLPSASGTTLPASFEAGDYFILQFAWKLANVYNNSELSVIGFVQDNQYKTIYQSANTTSTPITGVYQNDLELSGLSNVLPSYCEPSFAPQFRLQNNGTVPISSAQITYRVNDEPEATYQYSGNLGFLDKATIILPAINFNIHTSNTLKIYGTSINGIQDDYRKNDTITYAFAMATPAGTTASVLVKTDNKPEETTWEIKDLHGNTVASGGPYTQSSHTYTTSVNLDLGTCYKFGIYDAGGNGVCCTNGMGFYKLSSGSTIIVAGTAFSDSVTAQFFTPGNVGLTEADAASFSVYPNPAWQKAFITFTHAVNEQVSVQVYDLQGAEMLNLPVKEYASGQHQIELNCSALKSGVYMIRLAAGSKVFTQKITISR